MGVAPPAVRVIVSVCVCFWNGCLDVFAADKCQLWTIGFMIIVLIVLLLVTVMM